MPQRMNHIGLVAAIIFLSGLSTELAWGNGTLIRVDHFQWDCGGDDAGRYCHISFELVNTTRLRQMRKVHIRAAGSPGDPPGERALAYGQMNFSILLEAGEVVRFKEIMPVTARPLQMTIAIRE